MDINKIEKLLQSENLEDILLAINLSYKLPFEEFDALFSNKVPTRILPDSGNPYYFIRNGKIYYMGSAYLGRVYRDYNTLEEFSNNYDITRYTDLTPYLEQKSII